MLIGRPGPRLTTRCLPRADGTWSTDAFTRTAVKFRPPIWRFGWPSDHMHPQGNATASSWLSDSNDGGCDRSAPLGYGRQIGRGCPITGIRTSETHLRGTRG